MGTLQRIKQFINYIGFTNQKFEKIVGFSNGAFSSQLRNNKTIGVDKLENILSKFPELNPEWLLTGRGHMLREKILSPERLLAISLLTLSLSMTELLLRIILHQNLFTAQMHINTLMQETGSEMQRLLCAYMTTVCLSILPGAL